MHRPAIALSNVIASDAHIDSSLRSDAHNAAKAVGNLVLARNGEPAVQLVPVAALTSRNLGHFKGLFTVPDDFDDEDSEIEALFNR